MKLPDNFIFYNLQNKNMTKQIFTLILICIFFSLQIDAQPIKKVLIEKYTSAYCGNCPRASEQLKELTANNDNVIWLSHHADFIPDAMHLSELDAYSADFAGSSAPRASFDRVLFDGANYVAVTSGTWTDRLATQLAEPAHASIHFDGYCDLQTLYLTATIYFATLPEPGDIRLTVFAVEDVVVGSGSGYDQANYDNNNPNSSLFGLGHPITAYEHLNVTRAVISDLWGTPDIVAETPEIDVPYSHEFVYNFPVEFDMHDMRIVAVLHYHDENDLSKRYVINAEQTDAFGFIEVSTEQADTPTFAAYPNPFSDRTFIEINNLPAAAELRAYTMTGQNVSLDYTINTDGIIVRNNHLASGTYLFQIVNTDDNMMIGKGKWIVR